MKREMSKGEAKIRVADFFKRKEFSAEEVEKIKKIAMKYKIRLGEYRKKICKGCSSQLKGQVRVTKKYKKIICNKCGLVNKQRINLNK